ncbi:MAG: histidine phosphatase family protein [Solirubrobacterales bacterium]
MIYLLRHGDAERGRGDDAARRLTAKGKRQARSAGEALARLDAGINACLTSPKVRAAQTAQIACARLGLDPEPLAELSGGNLDLTRLAAGRGEVLVVAHEPDLCAELARHTGARARMRKGGLAIIDGSALVALLGPAELAAISG